MLDAEYPNCTMSPCTTIPGPTGAFYWSSSTDSNDPTRAWQVFHGTGGVVSNFKTGYLGNGVRAVRGGS